LALYIACSYANLEIIELLLKCKIDVNADNGEAVRLASQSKRVYKNEVVDLLIKSGANVNLHNKDGLTALMVAARNGDKNVIETLISHGAISNRAMNDGRDALTLARSHADNNIVALLEKCADAERSPLDNIESEEERARAVGQIEDQSGLAKIASDDSAIKVRLAAYSRLLKQIARSCGGHGVRYEHRYLEDIATCPCTAVHSEDMRHRRLGVRNVRDDLRRWLPWPGYVSEKTFSDWKCQLAVLVMHASITQYISK
jgi:hypothetical protein